MTIRLVALAFLLVALLGLSNGLIDWFLEMPRWARRVPWIDWDREKVVIAEFTEFTIALIPIVWIYLYAAARARWVVLFFGLLKLASLWWAISITLGRSSGLPAPTAILEAVLIGAALGLLFAPSSVRWLKAKQVNDDEGIA